MISATIPIIFAEDEATDLMDAVELIVVVDRTEDVTVAAKHCNK